MKKLKYDLRNERDKVGYALLSLMQAFIKIDRKTRYFGTDVPIHFAEVHMIQSIAENPGIHIAGLAELHGITKGSVSEIVRKIEKKGLVIKKTDPENVSRLSLILTKKAEKANRLHTEYHSAFNKVIAGVLHEADNKEVRFLLHFLDSLSLKADYLKKNMLDID